MGKKKAASTKPSLGRSLIKDRNRSRRRKGQSESWLHTSDLGDGYDWNKVNLRSVTEESRLDEFLRTAQLAGTEFTAEKLNIRVVDPAAHTGLPSAEERAEIEQAQEDSRQYLCIPRRPSWDSSTTAEELEQRERAGFLEWRRGLAQVEERDHRLVLTPFEKNLLFWRQLWRVIEKSDIIVQIVDARNPLLFRCEDLEKYVKEVDPNKVNMLLVSKADLLTQEQRKAWIEYFSSNCNITVAFWSAIEESERLLQENRLGEAPTATDVMLKSDSSLESDSHSSMECDQDQPVELHTHGPVRFPRGDSDSEDESESYSDSSGEDEARTVGVRGAPLQPVGLGDASHSLQEESDKDIESLLAHSSQVGQDATVGGSVIVTGDGSGQSHLWSGGEEMRDVVTAEAGNHGDDVHDTMSDQDDTVGDQDDRVDDTTDLRLSVHEHRQDGDSDPDPSQHLISESSRHDSSHDTAAQDHEDTGQSTLTPSPTPLASSSAQDGISIATSARLLTREELLQLFLLISPVRDGGLTTVGMVGYPNVGKSSTINTLFLDKKVPVSATPGRTKHFQTLYVSPQLLLCDCPGLVFPTFITSKAEMVCSAILPIDQMRDHIPPIALVCQRIPRLNLEQSYSVRLPRPREGEDPHRQCHAHELLNAYGYMRGFMTVHGMPDQPRSARHILKHYVTGKLLYCHAPPGVDPQQFNGFPRNLGEGAVTQEGEPGVQEKGESGAAPKQTSTAAPSEFDKTYFKQGQVRAISKGIHGRRDFVRQAGFTVHHSSMGAEGEGDLPGSETASFVSLSSQSGGKPWKKHHKQHRKEKTKRLVEVQDSSCMY